MNAGFRVGFLGGFFVIVLHLFTMMLLAGAQGHLASFAISDLIVWILECILFYILGSSAAQQQYDNQQSLSEPLAGVQSAGAGAALVTWVIGWIFYFGRAFAQDLMGGIVVMEPLSLCASLVITCALALALGNLGGSAIVKKYNYVDYQNYHDF